MGRIGAIKTDGTDLTYDSRGITANPVSIVGGPDGNLYFGEFGNKIGRITTAGVVTEYVLPPGPGPNGFHVRAITVGPDKNIWFHEAVGKRIGRLTI